MDPVLVERDEGVVTVTLNRPHKKNAVDGAMVRDLRAALDEVATTPSDRVLVLTGAGASFCSGADLTDDRPPRPRRTDAEPRPRADTEAASGSEAAAEPPRAGGERTTAFSSVRVGSGLRLLRSSLGDLALALHRLPKPTIAKVNGVASGMGAS